MPRPLHLLLHVEKEEDQGSLQTVEDREDVPAEGQVGESSDETRHPRHPLDHRKLHVHNQT